MQHRLPRPANLDNGKPLEVPEEAIEADCREAAYLNSKPNPTRTGLVAPPRRVDGLVAETGG
jgi:hypothetical protein